MADHCESASAVVTADDDTRIAAKMDAFLKDEQADFSEKPIIF